MYKNKYGERNNICGIKISNIRQSLNLSQRELADRLQLAGIDLDKYAMQKIESGKRFLTDIELRAFAEIFGITTDELYKM